MATVATVSTPDLLAVYEEVRTTPRFLQQLLSPAKVYSEREEIEFDVSSNAVGLAPFVRSNAPGIPTRGTGFITQRMSPAYIKLLDAISTSDIQPSWYAGERPWSRLSDTERFNRMRGAMLYRHSEMIDVRKEWMMAELLRNGGYTVKFQGRLGNQEDTYTLDFQRDASLDMTPAILWDQPTAVPLSDMEAFFTQITSLSQSTVRAVVAGKNVASTLVRHEDFNDANRLQARILASAFDTSRLQYVEENAVQEFGSYRNVNYYTYSGQYHKADGTREYFVRPNEVLVICSTSKWPTALELVGKIRDLNTLDKNIDVFTKEHEVFDPSGIEMLTQASLLMGTHDANLFGRMTVLA